MTSKQRDDIAARTFFKNVRVAIIFGIGIMLILTELSNHAVV